MKQTKERRKSARRQKNEQHHNRHARTCHRRAFSNPSSASETETRAENLARRQTLAAWTQSEGQERRLGGGCPVFKGLRP